MKYISMLDPFSFAKIWQKKPEFILNLINDLLNIEDHFIPMNLLFKDSNIKGYFILEGKKYVVFFDFNFKVNFKTLDDDLNIGKFIKVSTNKIVYLIIFNNFSGINHFEENIYLLYNNKNNIKAVEFIYAKSKKEQLNINIKLTKMLYEN